MLCVSSLVELYCTNFRFAAYPLYVSHISIRLPEYGFIAKRLSCNAMELYIYVYKMYIIIIIIIVIIIIIFIIIILNLTVLGKLSYG